MYLVEAWFKYIMMQCPLNAHLYPNCFVNVTCSLLDYLCNVHGYVLFIYIFSEYLLSIYVIQKSMWLIHEFIYLFRAPGSA